MGTQRMLVGMTVLLLGALDATAAEYRGILTRVDLARNEIAVEGRGPRARGMSMNFSLLPESQVRFGMQPGLPSELEVGRNVTIFHETRDGRNIANLIRVSGSRPAVATVQGPNAITGTLRKVAVGEREIILVLPGEPGSEQETTLQVAENVQVSREGKAIRFEDLKVGDPVQVQTEQRASGLTAKVIQIGAPPPVMTTDQKIAKVRQVLQQVDFVLRLAEAASKGK